jgi:hypothetical protein
MVISPGGPVITDRSGEIWFRRESDHRRQPDASTEYIPSGLKEKMNMDKLSWMLFLLFNRRIQCPAFPEETS